MIKREHTNVRMEKQLKKELKEEAKEANRTFTNYIETILINRNKPKQK